MGLGTAEISLDKHTKYMPVAGIITTFVGLGSTGKKEAKAYTPSNQLLSWHLHRLQQYFISFIYK
jgi:hypothetical protein